MESEVSIISVASHRLYLIGIKAILEDEDNYQIIKELDTGQALIDLLPSLSSEVIVCNFHVRDMNIWGLIDRVMSIHPECKLLIIGGSKSSMVIDLAKQKGVPGYLNRGASPAQLVMAVKALSEDRIYYV